jgi:hypothetical protein
LVIAGSRDANDADPALAETRFQKNRKWQIVWKMTGISQPSARAFGVADAGGEANAEFSSPQNAAREPIRPLLYGLRCLHARQAWRA